MKKIKLLVGSLVLLSLVLVGCSKEKTATNKAPSIVGVKDIKCIVDTTVDFLDGVAALDKEDGDITPDLQITITPHVEVNENGYATFKRAGEYSVNYQITDSAGRTIYKRSYVDVVTREEYASFKMPVGFTSKVSGEAEFETCGMVNGKFEVVATGGQVAEDIQISRSFKLVSNLQYNFIYMIDARCEGKIKALANGLDCAEMKLEQGLNRVVFSHVALSSEDYEDVEITLCFGNINPKVDLTIVSVDTEYPQEAGKKVDLTENFSFAGRVIHRFDDEGGTNGLVGNCWAEADGKTAVLEITSPCQEIWRGGMFINTGITLKDGVSYEVEFEMSREQEEKYEIVIQRSQWDEEKIYTIYEPVDGLNKVEFTANQKTKGPLWIYVQSGNVVNRIRMTNLKVTETLNPFGGDSYKIEDYKEFHNDQFNATFDSTLGYVTYNIESFAKNDGDQKITSPSFFVNGSGGNYVLSFKAKASAPIEVVVAAPVADGWDPTLMWSKITLTEEETVYTFFFNGNGSDRDYVIVWQFGSENNQRFNDVKIEISEVSINLRNRELDG